MIGGVLLLHPLNKLVQQYRPGTIRVIVAEIRLHRLTKLVNIKPLVFVDDPVLLLVVQICEELAQETPLVTQDDGQQGL